MIHKNIHRVRMRLGQHPLFGSTSLYFGLILADNKKHRTWMGIDIHLPIWNLRDSWSTLAATLINHELKQALNHNWYAWIPVILNAM